jgi:hypothetical protein
VPSRTEQTHQVKSLANYKQTVKTITEFYITVINKFTLNFSVFVLWHKLLVGHDHTPLDERDLYLTAHTRNKNPCLRWDSKPQSQEASGRRPTP